MQDSQQMNASLTYDIEVDENLGHGRARQQEIASRLIAARHARRKFLPSALFGEPGWEMLLLLYVAKEQGQRTSVTTLCHNSGFPPTTALRWLHFLEAKQLVHRDASPVDKRIYYLDLTEKARLALDRLLLQDVFA
jgi:DNA-binding MarR family transcriptional regulator